MGIVMQSCPLCGEQCDWLWTIKLPHHVGCAECYRRATGRTIGTLGQELKRLNTERGK